jgi:hypothetical protein
LAKVGKISAAIFLKYKKKFLGEPLRGLRPLASGYSRFASLIPARFALGTARGARRRYYPSRGKTLLFYNIRFFFYICILVQI